jgi:choline dehydrogenase-like flavoprotein
MTIAARSAVPTQPALLSPAERRTLEAACQALLPALAAEADDDPRLFALDAASVGVPGALEQALATLDAPQQAQFRQLLRALELPLLIGLLIGVARRFSALTQPQQECALTALSTSRAPQLRSGFQALKRLATFLFYSLTDSSGHNPTWPALGYTPSTNPPAASARLTLTTISAPTTLECDVCVIGSGAGGSVAAAELAAAGLRVIVLEAGSGQQAPDFDQREFVGMDRLYLDHGLTASRDLGVAILAGATLGGGTAVNWQTSLRTPDAIRDEWAARSGCAHFADVSFTQALDAVSARLNVGLAESEIYPNNAMLRDGCAALGYHHVTLPRNAKGCDATQCGFCVYGCRHGGKQSTAVTYLVDAQQHGDTMIVPHCRAERVLIANGRVTGVAATATHPSSGRTSAVEVRAARVVAAAGAIHSPALLLRSGLDLPALGRHLYLHPTSSVSGVYAAEIAPWLGPPQSVLCDEFANLSGAYGFRLETAPAHPGLLALGTPWFSARSHRREMQQARHKSAIIVLARDALGGRVRLSRSGRPVIDYRIGAQEQTHLRQGIAAAVRVHLAAGAHEVLTLFTREQRHRAADSAALDAFCDRLARCAIERNWSTIFSAHQMGTCRMGRDARTAVCDERGAVFGVRGLFMADASAFPASSGVNPMITIMALAHHTAQRIKAE